LVFPLLTVDTTPASRFDFLFGIFADFEREPGFELISPRGPSKVGDITSHHLDPANRFDRGVRSSGTAPAPSA
jgi:hypothetical protein